MFKCLRWPKYRILLVSIAVLLLIVEYGFYYYKSFTWRHIACRNDTNCIKILLVADPQIIGNHNEKLHWITPINIWDSDRYLHHTFQYANKHVNPDVTIFLGDLFDEGSTASDKEFNDYAKRLFNIFFVRDILTKHIWLPGDNDIGGESERITPQRVKRFNHAFQQPDIISIKNYNFYKINKLVKEIPVIQDEHDFNDLESITIGLSHIPLLFIPSTFVEQVINKLKPHILFSAHEHKSMKISMDSVLMNDRQVTPIPFGNNDVFSMTLGINDVYEVIIPTCSYRMGTSTIGYGYAVIEDNELRYTVLWSPSRFFQLLIYASIILLYFYIVVIRIIVSKCKSQSTNRQYSKIASSRKA